MFDICVLVRVHEEGWVQLSTAIRGSCQTYCSFILSPKFLRISFSLKLNLSTGQARALDQPVSAHPRCNP